jgi:threonine/homoserine/homoserine lactone efflux protein
MTLFEAFTLFLVMLVLAAMPSASVALVVTRSATLGVCNGAAVAAGIVIGDLLFVSLAILGMSILAESMGAFFAVFKYLGGLYLIWLGMGLLRSRREVALQSVDSRGSTLLTSLASGLVLTLGDVKAVLFYASLFPTFIDMARLTVIDVGAIVAITIVTVGGVKLGYAFAAQRIIHRLQSQRSQRRGRLAAGGLMIGAGTYLVSKA